MEFIALAQQLIAANTATNQKRVWNFIAISA